MTSAFAYRTGRLCVENVELLSIANDIDTPFYVYSADQLKKNYQIFADSFVGLNVLICYAVKANTNLAVIRTLANCGAGADVTSAGELLRALAAGISPEKI